MSSVGQAIGGLIGAVAGFFMGGPAGALKGFSLGASIGGMLDPPKGPNQTGPRLTDLSAQTSTYGTPIPRVYGTIATLGNIFWLQCDKLTEVVTVSKNKGGKGGGGKSTTTTYSYNATFAVGLCQGEIAGVRRIWVGANLIYDAGSDDLNSILASNAAASGFKIYTGSETQTADPRMQADKGVANVPAYRGLAYIVFYDFALKDYGNSLLGAQVKVEVIKSAQTAYARVQQAIITTPGYMRCNDSQNDYPVCWITSSSNYDMTYYRIVGDKWVYLGGAKLTRYNSSQGRGYAPFPSTIILEHQFDIYRIYYLSGSELKYLEIRETDNLGYSQPRYFIDDNSQYVYLSAASGASPYLYRISFQSGAILTRLIAAYAYESLCEIGGVLYAARHTSKIVDCYNAIDLSFIETLPIVDTPGMDNIGFLQQSDLTGGLIAISVTGYTSAARWNGATWKMLAQNTPPHLYLTHDANPQLAWGQSGPPYYNDITETWKAAGTITGFEKQFVTTAKALTGTSATLDNVISAECLSSGLLEATDIDVTAIDSDVRGYRISEKGAIRAALEPLQGAFPFDVIPKGYKIAFVPRGGTSVKTISDDILDARAAGSAPGVALTISREMDSQLPRRVSIKYFDNTREYDISEQYAERLNTDAVNVLDSTLPIVLNATEAAGVAEKLLYLYWLERYNLNFALPPEYIDLEPGDVITLTGDFGTYEIRLTEINYTSGGWLECKGRLNNSSVYTAAAIGEEGSSTGKTIAYGGLSYYALLDIPCMQDVFNAPGFPAAMCGFSATWPGGTIFKSNDNGQTWTDVQGFTGSVPIGISLSVLAAGRVDIIDTTNTLSVSLLAGELVSVTQAQLFNGANYFAIGAHGRWEIVAAQNCALQLDGSYILSDFLRGRFGTEWAMSTHAVGDAVVLLTDADMAWIGIDTASIGLERQYRGITNGALIDSDASLDFTYSGVNLECLSPVYLNGNRHPSTNDWTLTWIRRTRIDGALRNYVDVSLGETAESYEIDIYSDGTYATVKRTITASSATAAYTSAQQTTDFGGNQTTLYVKVYQLSATVGRGYPLTATITR